MGVYRMEFVGISDVRLETAFRPSRSTRKSLSHDSFCMLSAGDQKMRP